MRLTVESAARTIPGITEQLSFLATFQAEDLLQAHTKTLLQQIAKQNDTTVSVCLKKVFGPKRKVVCQ